VGNVNETAREIPTKNTKIRPMTMFNNAHCLGFHRVSFIFHAEQERKCNQCRL
jgi:hypothetical protein